jgi:hypothetical protein
VKKTVDHDFVPISLQGSEPSHEFAVLGQRALVVIIRHHKNGTNAHAVRAQFRNNCTCDSLSARGDIVQRHDDGIRRRGCGDDERKELRCRNCTHIQIFCRRAALNKVKRCNTLSFRAKSGNPAAEPTSLFHGILRLRCATLRMTSRENPCLRFPETPVRPEA